MSHLKDRPAHFITSIQPLVRFQCIGHKQSSIVIRSVKDSVHIGPPQCRVCEAGMSFADQVFRVKQADGKVLDLTSAALKKLINRG